MDRAANPPRKDTPRYGATWRCTAVLVVWIAVEGCGAGSPPSRAPSQSSQPASLPAETTHEAMDQAVVLRPDDGQTLWVSPTAGGPLDLSGAAEGAELVLVLRPAALLASDEGKRLWRALGPAGESARAALAATPLETLDRLVVSLGPGTDYGKLTTTLCTEAEPSDEAPLLQREIELLAASADNDRHMTLLFSPKFLLGDGGTLLNGAGAPLREWLVDLVGEDWKGVSLSLHLEERLYWELRVVGTAATRETVLAGSLEQLSSGWSEALQKRVASRAWPDYSSRVVQRAPQMAKELARYARPGTDGRQAVLNGYLPRHAAHNMALSAELLLAGLSVPATLASPTSPSRMSQPPGRSLEERLAAPITLQFRREPLENALRLLSDATDIPITIDGRDLQLEGITRNQLLGLDQTAQPAGEVLLQILHKANPDTMAKGPTDLRQKLVYVVRKDGLHITTRSATTTRNESLPAPFID